VPQPRENEVAETGLDAMAEDGTMSAQHLYRVYRAYAVELAPKHGVELHQALLALARAAAECPAGIEPAQAAQFIRERIEQEFLNAGPKG
jgi:hypothetical protein